MMKILVASLTLFLFSNAVFAKDVCASPERSFSASGFPMAKWKGAPSWRCIEETAKILSEAHSTLIGWGAKADFAASDEKAGYVGVGLIDEKKKRHVETLRVTKEGGDTILRFEGEHPQILTTF